MDIFSPIQVGALALPNRVAMAPMTRNRAPGAVPGASAATYYAQRAGAGLIISEATQVTPYGVGYPNTPGIHSDDQVAAWRRVTDAVHEGGGRILLQLWHTGRVSHPSLQPGNAQPVAPSAIAARGEAFTPTGPQPFPVPRALETDEIPALALLYADGTRRARAAGFDGVEIHGANGYLIDQFLRDGSNQRTDRYGGSVENRARFLLEVTEAVIDAWSADHVGVRLSPYNPFNDMRDSDPHRTFGYAAEALGRLDLAYLHLMLPIGSEPAGAPPIAPALRRAFKGPLMLNGGYDRSSADAAVRSGAADLVSIGVPFLANPDLVERWRRGAPLNEADRATFYGGDDRGYIDYPVLAAA